MHREVITKYSKYAIFRKTKIPYLAEVEKMGLTRQPVGATSAGSVAAQQYNKLWQELWERSERT